jgi:hypothetical protein
LERRLNREGMFYFAQNRDTKGAWIYINRKDIRFGKDVYYGYTIDLDQNVLYFDDLWPEHLLNQPHIKEKGDERSFVKLLFETKIEAVKTEEY